MGRKENMDLADYLIAVPGEILALFVAPAYSALGIGRALAARGIEIARGAANGKIKLESTLNAVTFYKKLGFTVVGRGLYSHDQTVLRLPIIHMRWRDHDSELFNYSLRGLV